MTTSKSYERQPIDGAEELVRDDVNRWTASTAALVLGLALGCDGAEPAPEQRLSEAAETLEDARADQTEARDRVAEARERLREAEEAYDQALEELERARQSVLTAQQRVERQATDVALFRAVQSALLHAEVLRGDAVVAAVHDGVVTLRGTVSSEEGKQRAVAIARDTAGVQGVRDALRVQRPQEVAARTPDEVQAEPAPRGAAPAESEAQVERDAPDAGGEVRSEAQAQERARRQAAADQARRAQDERQRRELLRRQPQTPPERQRAAGGASS